MEWVTSHQVNVLLKINKLFYTAHYNGIDNESSRNFRRIKFYSPWNPKKTYGFWWFQGK